MTLQETIFALEEQALTVRLLAFDDVWTRGLDGPISGRDRETLVDVGRQMESLVMRLRNQIPAIRELVFRDPGAFEVSARDLVERARLDADVKAAVAHDFEEFGWFVEAALALSRIEEGAQDVASELRVKSDELARSTDPDGDLPPWFRCATLVTGVALSVVGAIASGGATIAVSASVAGPFVAALGDIDVCRGPKKLAPKEAGRLDPLRAELEELKSLCDDKLLTLDECTRMKADILKRYGHG